MKRGTSKDARVESKQMRSVSDQPEFVQSRRQLLRRSLIAGSILAAWGTPAFPHASAHAHGLQAESPSPLIVDSAWLQNRIDAGRTPALLLDLGDLSDYRHGHLPGAVHGYWLETVERDYPYYGTVLNQFDQGGESEDQGKRLAWMRRYGISPDTDVIAYDHNDGRRAARIVWFLHFLGHTRASLLDGGYMAWRQFGGVLTDVTTNAPTPAAEPIVEPQSGFYVSTSELVQALDEPDSLLIDIRTDDERTDTIDGQFDTGVIPGSVRLPWREFLRPDGSGLIGEPEARASLEARGIAPERRIMLYGRFGCDPDLMWLIMKRSGFPSVEIYDRGWIEWSSTSGLPAESLS